MKTKISIFLAAAVVGLLIVSCVHTPGGKSVPGVPFVKDKVEGRYERPVDVVFAAAKDVIKFNGTLDSESTLHSQTNAVKIIEGRINQRSVWVHVEQVEPKITAVSVQIRTKGGGADLDLAHEIEKQIALKLAR